VDADVINGSMRGLVKLTQEEIEVLLGFVDATDDLDDDEVSVIDSIVRGLPDESIYNIRWFEDKLDAQRKSSR